MPFTYTHSWTLPATPEQVFRALTDPAELTQWFAEGVQIEPRINGVYRFWGRYTLGTPPQEDARQTISRFEPNSAFAFTWPINEVDTDVTMALAPDEKGTKLTLTHQVSADFGVPRQRELIEDHWRLAIGNLSAHLSGGWPMLPDYFDPAPAVRITTSIDAPPATVFRALVEKVDGRDIVGGPAKIVEIMPDKKLVLDWPDWRGDKSVTGQTITFLLAPDGKGGTNLTFAHAGFGRTTDMSDYGFGWRHFLDQLQKEATSG